MNGTAAPMNSMRRDSDGPRTEQGRHAATQAQSSDLCHASVDADSAPATKLLSSLAKNSAAAATSSARPSRPSGIIAVSESRTSSEMEPNIAVSVGPGLTTLTLMPRGASSFVHVRANARTAALLAP